MKEEERVGWYQKGGGGEGGGNDLYVSRKRNRGE